MGNAAAKEFQEKPLGTAPDGLHGEDGSKNSFSTSMICKENLRLTGKSVNEQGKGGYRYSPAEGKAPFTVRAHGLKGKKGNLEDVDGKSVAEIRVEHHMKTDTHRYYKTEACYEGQESEKVDDQDLFLFAKIEAKRTAQGSTSTYSVLTGKDSWEELYKGETIVARSFMALIKTSSGEEVGKITPLKGPRLQAEVAAGTDLAAVILTGEACSPTGGTLIALPGATMI